MTIEKAKEKYKEFQLKEPDVIIKLQSRIPRKVVPIGFCSQISYNSNKWNKDEKWHAYIHYWDHPTLVCVSRELQKEIGEVNFESGFHSDEEFDLGPGRGEITFLGYAIDFALTGDDRSNIRINPSTSFIDSSHEKEIERLEGSFTFEFNAEPKRSKDYVTCSPNGRVVYVVSDADRRVFCFLNNHCRVTSHGIEG